jgi:hypothetical protein
LNSIFCSIVSWVYELSLFKDQWMHAEIFWDEFREKGSDKVVCLTRLEGRPLCLDPYWLSGLLFRFVTLSFWLHYIFNSCLQLFMWFCDSLPYYYKHRLNSWKDELDLKINKLPKVHDLASMHSPLNFQQSN